MKTDLTSKVLFPTNETLLAWLEKNADKSLTHSLLKMKPDRVAQIRDVFNEFGAYAGKGDMGETGTLLGRAIANFLEAIKKEESLSSRSAQKAFVTTCTVAHFRLLDKGLSGEEQNFMTEHAAHLSKAFPNGPENDFVLPMADQAIDKIFEMLQRMNNPG